MSYSVEESPLGTAGSVRLAAGRLDDTFLVISGDALCDVDLTKLIEYHREKQASVDDRPQVGRQPLEFGIVVTDEDGRIERFLEKPSWGQVFSDTINTGIYVLEPEVLRHVPKDRPFDFSKELFPLLLKMGRPMYGYVMDGYWQDIGNLDQYRQANFDALDEKVALHISGIRIAATLGRRRRRPRRSQRDRGAAYLGNYCRVAAGGVGGPYSVLSTSVSLRERARTSRSIVDSSTSIGALDRRGGRDHRTFVRPARARPRPRRRRDRRTSHDRSESVIMPGVRSTRTRRWRRARSSSRASSGSRAARRASSG